MDTDIISHPKHAASHELTIDSNTFPENNIFNNFYTEAELQNVEGLYFHNQSLSLDGYRFVNCRFDNCLLHIGTSNFSIVRCIIDPSSKIFYSPATAKVVKLFLSKYNWAEKAFPETFNPIRDASGRITITGNAEQT